MKKYTFQFTLTNKAQQQQIMKLAMPKYFFLVKGLEPAFGVEEKEHQLFVVCREQKEKEEREYHQALYTTYFIVFLADKVLEASYTAANKWDEEPLTYDVPKEQEELIKQALEFWRNRTGRLQYEKSLMMQGISLQRLGDELRFAMFLDWKASLEAPNQGYLSFLKMQTESMKDRIERYANQAWASQECRIALEEIAKGDWEKFERKLVMISYKCEYEISGSGDDVADVCTKACKVLFDAGVDVPVDPVSDYLRLFEKKFNPVHVKELLEAIEAYQKPNISWEEESFRVLCAKLRYNIAKISPMENRFGMRYAETPTEVLNRIVEWHKEELVNMNRVKEALAHLNSAYGVANEKLFLTALSQYAESNYELCRIVYSFVAVLLETNQVIHLWCTREEKVGELKIDYLPEAYEEYREMLAEAVAFYRNREMHRQFVEDLKKKYDGLNDYCLRKKAHKELYASFPLTYDCEMQRTKNHPLEKVLRDMIELCETKAYIYGYDNTVIGYPATMEEIESWEMEHGFTLPDDYRHFLTFANGVQLLGDGECIFGLHEIGKYDEYLEEDYISIGTMIDLSNILCVSKSTGRIVWAENMVEETEPIFEPEYNEEESFVEALESLIYIANSDN